jgi:hypothetical protein
MIADWFNYLLLALYLHALGLLVIYLIEHMRKEWRTPHVNLAVALSVWVTGMTLLRVSSIVRIISDRTCGISPAPHDAADFAACIGGGWFDVLVYNVGVGINAFGLLCVLRVLASMHNEYAWIRLAFQSAALATIALAVLTFVP